MFKRFGRGPGGHHGDHPHGRGGGRPSGGGGYPHRHGGGHRFRHGRFLAAADLQLIILALLGDKPSHGYEIIKAVQERSAGSYSPSPGLVYPSLTYLEEAGWTTVQADGAKKLYSLTDTGRTQLEQNRERATALLADLARLGDQARRAPEAVAAEAGATAADPARAFEEARRDLKAAIFDALDASANEQSRVTAVLRRATLEIRDRNSGPDASGGGE
jgi:DNA-binding PadR family transcriptional regulator